MTIADAISLYKNCMKWYQCLYLSDNICGWDGIDNKIVKATRHTILQPVEQICNLYLANGIVPQQLKIDSYTLV